jgi:NRPS condensation-like uncharacterized protein
MAELTRSSVGTGARRPSGDVIEAPGQARRVPFSAREDMIVGSERRWPMTISIEAHTRHPLDEARLGEALRVAMSRHPLARVRREAAGPLTAWRQWEDAGVPAAGPLHRVTCDTEAELADLRDDWASHPLDPDDAPLFRMVLFRRPDHDVLLLVVHHAAFDGLSAVSFLAGIGEAYVELADGGGPDEPLASEDPYGELAPRSGLGAGRSRTDPATSDTHRAVKVLFKATPPTRLCSRGGLGGSPAYLLENRVLDAGLLAALRSGSLAAAVSDATVNDLLVAAHHLALVRWNEEVGRRTDVVSVTVPVAAPRPEGSLALTNLTDQATTTTTAADRADPRAVLRSIAGQMARIKRDDATRTAYPSLKVLGHLPAALRGRLPALVSVATRDRSLATSRLSNLGRMDGRRLEENLLVDGLWFSPPARPPQGLNVGALGYGGAVALAFRGCRSFCDRAALQHFAAIYLDTLDSMS